MKTTVKTLIFGMLLITAFSFERPVQAASEDACAIWLCLPGGFPQGCSGAYSEFKNRLKKGKSPLPDLSSCTTSPNGERVSGHYEIGYEPWIQCESGFVLREFRHNGSYRENGALCYKEFCAPANYASRNEGQYCENYLAIRREKPHFVKMWVDGEYLGQYFY